MTASKDAGAAEVRPPTVWKTRVFDLIDRLSGNRGLLESAVAQLRGGASLLDVGLRSGTIEDDPERKAHLEEHWIGSEYVQRVLGRALLRAGELALERRVPIDAYWVFAGERIEAAVSHNERQVTLIVVLPVPPTFGRKLPPHPHPRIEMFQ